MSGVLLEKVVALARAMQVKRKEVHTRLRRQRRAARGAAVMETAALPEAEKAVEQESAKSVKKVEVQAGNVGKAGTASRKDASEAGKAGKPSKAAAILKARRAKRVVAKAMELRKEELKKRKGRIAECDDGRLHHGGADAGEEEMRHGGAATAEEGAGHRRRVEIAEGIMKHHGTADTAEGRWRHGWAAVFGERRRIPGAADILSKKIFRGGKLDKEPLYEQDKCSGAEGSESGAIRDIQEYKSAAGLHAPDEPKDVSSITGDYGYGMGADDGCHTSSDIDNNVGSGAGIQAGSGKNPHPGSDQDTGGYSACHSTGTGGQAACHSISGYTACNVAGAGGSDNVHEISPDGNIYMVDTENVSTRAFAEMLSGSFVREDRVHLFYTDNNSRVDFATLDVLLRCTGHISVEHVKSGPNALDFQLVSILGSMIKEDPGRSFIIVSNDHGYDSVVSYWSEKGVAVKRMACSNAVGGAGVNGTGGPGGTAGAGGTAGGGAQGIPGSGPVGAAGTAESLAYGIDAVRGSRTAARRGRFRRRGGSRRRVQSEYEEGLAQQVEEGALQMSDAAGHETLSGVDIAAGTGAHTEWQRMPDLNAKRNVQGAKQEPGASTGETPKEAAVAGAAEGVSEVQTVAAGSDAEEVRADAKAGAKAVAGNGAKSKTGSSAGFDTGAAAGSWQEAGVEPVSGASAGSSPVETAATGRVSLKGMAAGAISASRAAVGIFGRAVVREPGRTADKSQVDRQVPGLEMDVVKEPGRAANKSVAGSSGIMSVGTRESVCSALSKVGTDDEKECAVSSAQAKATDSAQAGAKADQEGCGKAGTGAGGVGKAGAEGFSKAGTGGTGKAGAEVLSKAGTAGGKGEAVAAKGKRNSPSAEKPSDSCTPSDKDACNGTAVNTAGKSGKRVPEMAAADKPSAQAAKEEEVSGQKEAPGSAPQAYAAKGQEIAQADNAASATGPMAGAAQDEENAKGAEAVQGVQGRTATPQEYTAAQKKVLSFLKSKRLNGFDIAKVERIFHDGETDKQLLIQQEFGSNKTRAFFSKTTKAERAALARSLRDLTEEDTEAGMTAAAAENENGAAAESNEPVYPAANESEDEYILSEGSALTEGCVSVDADMPEGNAEPDKGMTEDADAAAAGLLKDNGTSETGACDEDEAEVEAGDISEPTVAEGTDSPQSAVSSGFRGLAGIFRRFRS